MMLTQGSSPPARYEKPSLHRIPSSSGTSAWTTRSNQATPSGQHGKGPSDPSSWQALNWRKLGQRVMGPSPSCLDPCAMIDYVCPEYSASTSSLAPWAGEPEQCLMCGNITLVSGARLQAVCSTVSAQRAAAPSGGVPSGPCGMPAPLGVRRSTITAMGGNRELTDSCPDCGHQSVFRLLRSREYGEKRQKEGLVSALLDVVDGAVHSARPRSHIHVRICCHVRCQMCGVCNRLNREFLLDQIGPDKRYIGENVTNENYEIPFWPINAVGMIQST